MEAFGNILVFHPAAIGDAMLASPVAATLKLNFPAARITYWTHPELRPILLSLCPSIDEIIDYDRNASMFELRKTLATFKADLFVDLANNTKSKFMTLMSRRTTVLRYEKQPALARPIRHATENFLDTIRPICPELPDFPFPTIFPEALSEEVVERVLVERGLPNLPIIGIVPGVGKHRPHRAWVYECWVYLLQHIGRWQTHVPALIGGSDEVQLCANLEAAVETSCLNLAGKLSLPETAAVLKHCQIVISGDTGPAHMAVAVGTPVIGLYGPTFPERSGPYGCLDMLLDQSEGCACHDQKHCRFANPQDPGQCMSRIMLAEVVERLRQVLQIPSGD
jgi:ADP-heptose:LPS heptosyltransferase